MKIKHKHTKHTAVYTTIRIEPKEYEKRDERNNHGFTFSVTLLHTKNVIRL